MSVELGVVIGSLLAIAAVVVVALPLRASQHDDAGDVPLADLLARRDTAYQLLRDLDSDFQSGKLAEDDYRPMRVQALAQAAEIVAQLDAYEAEKAAGGAGDQAESAASEARGEDEAGFCGNCGTARRPGDAFCRKCGQRFDVRESAAAES